MLIRNGRIVDGAGNPWFWGDVRIEGKRIAEMGSDLEKQGEPVIDARKRIVCPGFFDMHSHSEIPLLVDGEGHSKIRQGITTEVTGESQSPGPLYGLALEEGRLSFSRHGVEPTWTTLGEYFEVIEEKGISLNLISYVGHGNIRQSVFGNEPRAPTASELEEMKQLVAQAMEEGAFGLSSAICSPPGIYAEKEELVELCKVVGAHGGIHASHLRDEGDTILEALNEFIEVTEASNCPTDIFHLKVAGENNWRKLAPIVLQTIEAARARGVDITANQYPYNFSSLNLQMPHWTHKGGREAMVARLKDPEHRPRIRRELIEGWPGSMIKQARGEWEGIVVSSVFTEKNRPIQGKTIAEIGRMRGMDPVDVAMDLLIEENARMTVLYHWMSEEDIAEIMQTPWVSICTDGMAVRPEGILGRGVPHPRYYGTFPRILGRYVREKKVLRLEDAVRKMTSLAAQRLKIFDRGLLKPGMYADIVIFDPETVMDMATYQQPHQYPKGIDYVLVNGEIVIEEGEHTGARPGKVLRSTDG
jgi:N-acyl-D-aspartate/D-glutamate deacylase